MGERVTFGRQTQLEWRGDEVIQKIKKKKSPVMLYVASQIVERHLKRKFKQQTRGTGTGELYRSIAIRKSRFDGYIIGTFAQREAEWEDTVGARAIYFEYGRAAPGHPSRRTRAGRRQRAANKVQPARPFFSSALRASRTEIKRKLKLGTVKR